MDVSVPPFWCMVLGRDNAERWIENTAVKKCLGSGDLICRVHGVVGKWDIVYVHLVETLLPEPPSERQPSCETLEWEQRECLGLSCIIDIVKDEEYYVRTERWNVDVAWDLRRQKRLDVRNIWNVPINVRARAWEIE